MRTNELPQLFGQTAKGTDRVDIEWNDISLQDITEEAQAELYKAQAAKYQAEAKK